MRRYETKSEKLWQLLEKLRSPLVVQNLDYASIRQKYQDKYGEESISDALISRVTNQWLKEKAA